jgi:hypothetical protein
MVPFSQSLTGEVQPQEVLEIAGFKKNLRRKGALALVANIWGYARQGSLTKPIRQPHHLLSFR